MSEGAVVEVNECRITSTSRGADWLQWFRRSNPPQRFIELKTTIAGSLIGVRCDSAEDAELLEAAMRKAGCRLRRCE